MGRLLWRFKLLEQRFAMIYCVFSIVSGAVYW